MSIKIAHSQGLTLLLLVVLWVLLPACQPGVKEQELDEVKTRNIELLRRSLMFQSEIHAQQIQIDSLKTVINHLEQQAAKMTNDAPVLSEDEQELRQLVHRMHTSWKDLVEVKDPQLILDYFMPMFMANQIDVNSKRKGHVAAFTELDYHHFLEEIASRKRSGIEFGNVKFLDVTVKDRAFFNVAYKCQMREYQKDQLAETSTVIVTMTGKRIGDSWMIANYSVVSFEFSE